MKERCHCLLKLKWVIEARPAAIPHLTDTERTQFQGALVLLPAEATELANGPWQQAKVLDITVEDPELRAHGMIPLDGLGTGLTNLCGNCPRG
jgi:hypothetical protein